MITDAEVMALRQDAAMFGDMEQVHICDLALTGDKLARAICQDVIDYARDEALLDRRREILRKRYGTN